MWQFLLTAVVAGSTCFAAKRFFAQQTSQCSYGEEVPTVDDAHNSSHRQLRMTKVELRSVGEVRTVQCNGRRKWLLDFKKRRKTVNNISAKTAFLSFKRRKSINNNSPLLSPKKQAASVLFDSGVRFGIKCMMVGRAEVSELTKTMNTTAKIVEELKSEITIKKSPQAHQVLDYVGNIISGLECSNMSDEDEEIMLKKTNSELRETDSKFWCLPLIDNGECESSALTEDLDSQVLDMDQLEAELESELQKLPGDSPDTIFHEETRSKLYEIEQRENQIVELESELYLARSKLQEKEAELQALKNCVTLLIELPLSTVSGTSHGTKAHNGTTNWGYNTLDSMSEQSVGDVKTLIVCEPSDSDLYEHTKYIDKII
ncbi:hypothetical protein VNO80_04066 [Phaseolus coccineus]|uniref:Uncharacterized protein n=1 Tax=Phaseolus coccineus TaxID=3886 RepID=A0AAN9RJE0_PHACN